MHAVVNVSHAEMLKRHHVHHGNIHASRHASFKITNIRDLFCSYQADILEQPGQPAL